MIKKRFLSVFLLLLLFFTPACSRASEPAVVSVPTREPASQTATDGFTTPTPLPDGWTRIEPGGETRCAHDTDYAFWARPGTSNHLLVYFQGGGGCWDADTCSPGSTFFDNDVDSQDAPALRRGIFDLRNPENPFADYNMVYIPSCTGDVHWGDRLQFVTKDDGTELAVHFKGFVNGQAAIDWAYQNFPVPDSVFVTGCSAGSVGSAAHTPYIIENYPDTPVTQLGDSLAFVFHRPLNLSAYGTYENLPSWIPAMAQFQPDSFTMAGYYSALANHYPDYGFSQFNTSADHVQNRYYLAVGGQVGGFSDDLVDSLDEIHSQAQNFSSYLAGGDAHCVMPLNRFYTYATNGVRIRDWVADMASGQPVESVRCTDCSAPETVSP